MCRQPGYNIRPIAIKFLGHEGMDDPTTERSFDFQSYMGHWCPWFIFDIIYGCLYNQELADVRSTGAGIKYLYCSTRMLDCYYLEGKHSVSPLTMDLAYVIRVNTDEVSSRPVTKFKFRAWRILNDRETYIDNKRNEQKCRPFSNAVCPLLHHEKYSAVDIHADSKFVRQI